MKIIIIKTQAELDALPDKFEEYTEIRIEGGTRYDRIIVKKKWENSSVVAWGNSSVVAWGNSSVEAYGNSSVEAWDNSSVKARGNSSVAARGNSSVVAWGNSSVAARENSSVEAWDNSSVEAYGNSSVEAYGNSSVEAWDNSSVKARGNSSVVAYGNSSVVAYEFAMIAVLTPSVVIKHLADHTVASLRGVNPKIEKKDDTATVVNTPGYIEHSFETWLERGYVYADGIYKKFLSKKSIGEIEVFTVQDFPKKTESFVVRKGDQFSHGETVEKAIESLRYKLSDRDTTRFKEWKLTTKISVDDAIQAYRAITGACEEGTRMFCESTKIPEKLTVSKAIELTKGQYRNEQFAAFFN